MKTSSNKNLNPEAFTQWTRIHLSPNLLFSAFDFARSSREIEESKSRPEANTLHHYRGLVIGAILTSVTFLEAAINELYSAANDSELHQDSVSLDFALRLKALWKVDNFRRSARMLEKYQTALELAGKLPMPKGENPYQDAKLLVDLRNALVHFVPATVPTAARSGVEIPIDELGKQLRGKFAVNSFKQNITVTINDEVIPEGIDPFFPEQCLGSGCAYWSAQTALQFADSFFESLKIKWYYEYLKPIE